MVKKGRLGEFRELHGDLSKRIDDALFELSRFSSIEEVELERAIHHFRDKPHIEIKGRHPIRDNVVRVAIYARDGYGCIANLIVRGLHGMGHIPEYLKDYIRKLNEMPELYPAV